MQQKNRGGLDGNEAAGTVRVREYIVERPAEAAFVLHEEKVAASSEVANLAISEEKLGWIDPDDAPELTEAMLADAEVFDGTVFVRRGRGRPPTGNAKELVSLRLDQDVLAKLRAMGPGWQSQVNAMLRQNLNLGGLAAQDASAHSPINPGRRMEVAARLKKDSVKVRI